MHADEDYDKSMEQDSNDYSDFYSNSDYESDVDKSKQDNKSKKSIIVIIILIVLLIILIVVFLLLFRKKDPVDFNLTLENNIGDKWSKENATININILDDSNLKKLKYTINCDKNCDYVEVNDRKIVINNGGNNKVSVISVNTDNIEYKKDIIVKIDKVNPTLFLSPNDKNIKSTGPIKVCVICVDNESGCKEEKVCKSYSKTTKDQTLTVEDNVGNKTTSEKFDVTIS